MSRINSTSGSAATQAAQEQNPFDKVDLGDFLDLMIAELQNQDPLNPLENDQLLAQISQIREVGATDKLTKTLDAVLLGQNVASATSLIGADVVALDENNQRVSGNVRQVTIDNGAPTLDLAVDVAARAADAEGDVEKGSYGYTVVWAGPENQEFGVELDVDTEDLAGFNGTVQISNLPETTGEKRVYRTDKTGDGARKLVATVPGKVTTASDGLADGKRLDQSLRNQPQIVDFARRVNVKLQNVAEIQPPQ